ncbi:hypothetical protein K1719_004672 [Acacia pycnantha]|nr:hypothetical protein K1719_004672 [Acacia pycnantha]
MFLPASTSEIVRAMDEISDTVCSVVDSAELCRHLIQTVASSYPNLELLDLSGSSINDDGIGINYNAFPETLSRLLLALCPNVTSTWIFKKWVLRRNLESCVLQICSTSDSLAEFLASAVQAAQEAGEIIRKGFYQTKNVEHKGQDLETWPRT